MKHVDGSCKSSLGKRRVQCLKTDTHPSKISITFAPFYLGMTANCWITDDEGRTLGLVFDESTLRALHEQLGEAIKEQDAIIKG